jgi:hypothetical protein
MDRRTVRTAEKAVVTALKPSRELQLRAKNKPANNNSQFRSIVSPPLLSALLSPKRPHIRREQ